MLKALKIGSAVLLICVLGVAITVFSLLRASLPELDGQVSASDLSAPVTLTRDAYGVPTIRGSSRADIAYVTGYIHAQERFFQMDLQRRAGAGELSGLLGAATLEVDRGRRLHRFRTRSRAYVGTLADRETAILNAYTQGVNAGLDSLGSNPFEYWILRRDPEPWRPEDTILSVYAMYFQLQDPQNRFEQHQALALDILGKPMADFLFPLGTEWDAPLVGGRLPTPPTPTPEQVAALPSANVQMQTAAADQSEFVPGSNNWAVGGALTDHGGAIVANDMHLGIRVPNIWYKARVEQVGENGFEMTGVMLPGVPFHAVGSNGHIAWGFTNSQVDLVDIVKLEWTDEAKRIYKTPDGSIKTDLISEHLCVIPQSCEQMAIEETIWGPIIGQNHKGDTLVSRWIAHEPGAVNVRLGDLERAKTIPEAFEIANETGMPAQNFVVGDRKGNIGYTLTGPLPNRFGHDGILPVSCADGAKGWLGKLPTDLFPRIINPENSRIWTANSRVVADHDLATVGFGNYAPGSRATLIRDRLMAKEKFDEDSMHAIQNDDDARFHDRWRELFLETIDDAKGAELAALRPYVDNWGGRAVPNSVGFRLVREFRRQVWRHVLTGLQAPLRTYLDESAFPIINRQGEGPVWRLASDQPPHLLPACYESWPALLAQAGQDVLTDIAAQPDGDIEAYTWGAFNGSNFQHPLSAFVPLLGKLTDTDQYPLAGDSSHMPRIAWSTYGASERMVVSPGREEDGILTIPTGQSGHPLSPYYNKGHEDWVFGRRQPFLPGETEYVLTFKP